MNQKVLITGISGFAGGYLARKLLKDGFTNISGTYFSDKSVESLSDISSKLHLIKLDLTNKEQTQKAIEEIKPDEIYHLAAIAAVSKSFEDPKFVIENNIDSEVNLLEAVRAANLNSKIFIVSSAEVYGQVAGKDLPVDEETPLNPVNPYAVSKIAQDFLALQYYNAYKMNIIRVRPFNHIGPGQEDIFVTSSFAKKIAEIEKGDKEAVLRVGNLEAKRDFTNVRDMVRAYFLLMEKGKAGEVYNIGSGKSYKIADILNTLLSYSSKKIKVETDPSLLRPIDNPELVSDNSKLEKLIDWKPEVSLEDTLREILEYWRARV